MKIVSPLIRLIAVSTALVLSQPLFAHGESNPGPHGGFIRMPGAFHTEVIPEKNGLKIMLLDINFEHPQVTDSSVKAAIKLNGKSVALNCKANGDAFFCKANQELLKQGTLSVAAIRNKAAGAVMQYPLPLQLEEEHS